MTFFWYTLAGGVATGVHYVVLLGLVEMLAWTPALSAVAGASVGAVASYALNRRLAFKNASAGHGQALPRFFVVSACGALLNGAIVWLGVHLPGTHYLVAQGVATLVVLGMGFLLNRTWTFA
jgi:putative flippase GtrA